MAARITAYIIAAIVSITFIAGLIVGAQRDENGPVDLIVLNGRVYTADPQGTFAEAVAVQGNRILRVGSTRDISRLRRAQTVVIDAQGGAVLPGFNDAHTRLLDGGLALGRIDLSHLSTLDAVEREIATWATLHPEASWVVGRGWRYEWFPGGRPTRHWLDRIIRDRPVFLISDDGHTGWANTAALTAAGITGRTADPTNGTIEREARSNEPAGTVYGTALALVAQHLPALSRTTELAALRSAIGEAHRFGITSVQTLGATRELDLYAELRRQGELDLRVYANPIVAAPLDPAMLETLDLAARNFPDDPLLKTGAVAISLDGGVEARTAALLAPYAGLDEGVGLATFDQVTLNTMITELDRRGWQLLLQASGDRAVRMGLAAIEQAVAANPAPEHGRRHRLEQIETIDAADVPRIGALGVIASMQPARALRQMMPSLWRDVLGPGRAAHGWLFGRIAAAKGRLVFGSGWPVTSFDPFIGLHVAVNRTTLDGRPEGAWLPAERLSLAAAVDAYTRHAAWASFDDHRKGMIAPDMLADLVVLSQDVFSLAPDALSDAEVALTIFDGHVVYDRTHFVTDRISQIDR